MITIVILAIIVIAVGYFAFNGVLPHKGLDKENIEASGKEATITFDSEKTLVLYVSETGNTQEFAKEISDLVGGDLRRITPQKAYPSGAAIYGRTKTEADNDERPTYVEFDVNINEYDTIFIGYPIWWYKMPMLVYSFLDEYDLSGKTIIPFNTHEGSRDCGTYGVIKKLEPKAMVLDGLAIRGGNMKSDHSATIKSWFKGLGFESEK